MLACRLGSAQYLSIAPPDSKDRGSSLPLKRHTSGCGIMENDPALQTAAIEYCTVLLPCASADSPLQALPFLNGRRHYDNEKRSSVLNRCAVLKPHVSKLLVTGEDIGRVKLVCRRDIMWAVGKPPDERPFLARLSPVWGGKNTLSVVDRSKTAVVAKHEGIASVVRGGGAF